MQDIVKKWQKGGKNYKNIYLSTIILFELLLHPFMAIIMYVLAEGDIEKVFYMLYLVDMRIKSLRKCKEQN